MDGAKDAVDGVVGVDNADDDGVKNAIGGVAGVDDAGVGRREGGGRRRRRRGGRGRWTTRPAAAWRTRAAGSVEVEGRCCSSLSLWSLKGLVDREDTEKGAHRHQNWILQITTGLCPILLGRASKAKIFKIHHLGTCGNRAFLVFFPTISLFAVIVQPQAIFPMFHVCMLSLTMFFSTNFT